MKMIRRQKLWLIFVVITNLALWIIPSDVVEQIARDNQTLLGRYSRQHFTWIVVVAIISVISFYIDWSTGERYKRRWFQVLAVSMVALPCLGVLDFLARRPERNHYVRDTLAYHRPPNATFELTFEDKPLAYRSYPDAPPGYPDVPCVMNTDHRGFRNQTDLPRYDVVVLGDSFAEGSSVSDEHAWPRQLAERTGLSVYNLGMSGYAPLNYAQALAQYALPLKPRFVVCLLYEGNDFRSAKADRKSSSPSASEVMRRYFKQSPLLEGFDRFLVDTFGPLRSQAPVAGIETLDWMPLAVPPGSSAHHYAFAPKQLCDLFVEAKAFSRDRHWLGPRKLLEEMKATCDTAGCTFIVAYAPTAPHVVLPLAADNLDPEKVRAFTALNYKGELPPGKIFLAELLTRLDARETVVSEWCRREAIPMVPLTQDLRGAAASGIQVYYTYDQHWTPEGHRVVADRVAAFLAERTLTGESVGTSFSPVEIARP